MANQRVTELYVESILCHQPLTPKRIEIVEPDVPEAIFDVTSAAGGILINDHDVHGLIWSIDASKPGELNLLEFSQREPVRGAALQLAFPSILSPHVALSLSGEQLCVYVVTARGSLHAINLPGLHEGAGNVQHSSILARVPADGSAVSSADLSNDLGRLGPPTAMATAEGFLCMGCQRGSVLCIPQASLHAGTFEGGSELKDAGGVGRMLTSLFARQASPAVKGLAAVSIGTRQLMAAAYADGSLRLWDLLRQACVLHELLKPDSTTVEAMAPTRLRFAAPPPDEYRRPGKLVVQFDRPEGGQDSHFAVFELNGEASSDGTSISALSLQQVAILERAGATSAAGPAGDLAARQRPAGRVRAWALGHDGGVFAMDEAAVSRGVRGADARLLGDDISELTSAAEAQLQLQEDLWRSVALGIEKSGGQAPPPDLPARHFVGRLLAPGSFSYAALHVALTALGCDIATADLARQPVSELQQITLQAVRERAADVGQFAAVHALLRSYWGALLSAQRPLGLLSGGPSAPSVIRGGPTLSLLRPAGPARAQALGHAVPGLPAPSQALQRVALASSKLRELLGPMVHSLVGQLLAEGLPLGQAILPALVHAIAIGPTSEAATAGARAGSQTHYRELQSQWRRQRSRLALEIGALLEPIRSPEEALVSYVALPSARLPQPPAASQQVLPASSFLAAVAREEAAAAADAALDLLLLIAYLGKIRSLGSFSFHGPQAQGGIAWQSRVAAQAEAVLRRAEIVRWMCTAAAAAARAASGDPASLLHQLQLGRDSSSAAFPAAHPGPQVQDRTLAEVFLPYVGPALSAAPEEGGALGVGFAAALLRGEAGSNEAEAADEAGLLSQVMSIGRVLFIEKQLPPLLLLLRLAGPICDDPGLQFLQGYALLDQLRSVTDPGQRAQILEGAAGPLFRAASDLAASGADAGRESFVRGLLGVLVTDMSGSYEPEGPQAERLQYYEALMLVCERLGCPEGAARFAQAAVRQVDVAYSPGGGQTTATDANRAAREGRLWANLFVYSLDAGRYEAAYAAMHANPVPERQLDCLQPLLGELCARGHIAALVSLPFAGTLDVGSRGAAAAVLSLADEASKFLRRRADNAELSARPQPYQVLHDFYVARSDFRGAAAAQLALARRLRDEAPAAVDAVRASLSAALNALSLVEPAHAWLEDPAGADVALAQQGGPFRGSPHPNRFLPGTASPRSPLPGRYNEDPLTAAAAGPALATPDSLRKELALVQAISLAARSAGGGGSTAGAADRPGDVLQLLIATSHFEAAIRLAEALYSNAELAKWLERIVAALAAACVRLQQQEHQPPASRSHTEGAAPGALFGSSSSTDAGAEAQNSAAAAWGVLRRHLEGGTGGPSAGRLRAAAADAILAAEPRFALPAWLLQLFQVGDASRGMAGSAADPAALLRVFMRRGRLEDAARLALAHLRAWQTQVVDVQRQRHGGVWFPHDLLGDLLAQLDTAAFPAAAWLRPQLDEALQAHYSAAAQQSAILEQRSALG